MTERRDNVLLVHWHDLGRYLGAYGNQYDGPAAQTALLQPETVATMNFLQAHHFVASVNFPCSPLPGFGL